MSEEILVNGKKLIVVTCVDPNSKTRKLLLESLSDKITPLIDTGSINNVYKNKIVNLWRFLSHVEFDYIVYADIHDTILNGDLTKIPEILEKYKCLFLFGGERSCWPWPKKHEAFWKSPHVFGFPNTSVWAATKEGFNRFFSEAMVVLEDASLVPYKESERNISDDQALLCETAIRHMQKRSKDFYISIDVNCLLVTNLQGRGETKHFSNFRLAGGIFHNLEKKTESVFVHGSGTSLSMVEDSWSKLVNSRPRNLTVVSSLFSNKSGFFRIWLENKLINLKIKDSQVYLISNLKDLEFLKQFSCNVVSLDPWSNPRSDFLQEQNRSILIGAAISYHNNSDFLYIDPSLLCFGDWLSTFYSSQKELVCVSQVPGIGSLVDPGFIFVRREFILEFISALSGNMFSDDIVRPETKASMLVKRWERFNSFIVQAPYGKSRPWKPENFVWYIKDITPADIEQLCKSKLI